MKHILTGRIGEALAENYLKKKGYKILKRNLTNFLGEIDLVAKDLWGTIIFVEVKTRSSFKFGAPAESVTKNKQHKIRKTAELFLKQNKLLENNCRFDVLEVLGSEINHIENAF